MFKCIRISTRSLASLHQKNMLPLAVSAVYSSDSAIMWHYIHDTTLNHFSSTPTCDIYRHADGQTQDVNIHHTIISHVVKRSNYSAVMWRYSSSKILSKQLNRLQTSRWSVVSSLIWAQSALSRSYTVESAPLQYSMMFPPCLFRTITCN